MRMRSYRDLEINDIPRSHENTEADRTSVGGRVCVVLFPHSRYVSVSTTANKVVQDCGLGEL